MKQEERLRQKRRLSDLKRGERARIAHIDGCCPVVERRRLLDLGFVPGTAVFHEFSGPKGGPVAYRVRDTLLALRRGQSDVIYLEDDPL